MTPESSGTVAIDWLTFACGFLAGGGTVGMIMGWLRLRAWLAAAEDHRSDVI